jgi:pimeloyl-ACP methyl ester carboxylesterase
MSSNTYDRRRFLGAAAMGALGLAVGSTGVAAADVHRIEPADGPRTAFKSLKQIDAGLLNVGYAEDGPSDGTAVVLLHGWPYDIHSYVDVAPLLAARGYHVIVPYLRGYGSTRFLSDDTMRNGQQSVVALDIVALMDALKIQKAILGGYDWGSRTVDIIAALWPERCKALVSVTGYLITNLAGNKLPLPPKAENAWWYQYYFCTERGVLGLEKYRYEFGEFVWRFNSPTWHFSTATYDQTAAAFSNPDYIAIVIGNYRWRLSLYPSEPEYASIEKRLQKAPHIAVPTITVDGEYDPFTPAGDGAAYRGKFTGRYAHETLPVGHNVPQEDPQGFAEAVVKADHF